MSLQGDTHASHSAQQVNETAQLTLGTYGPTLGTPLAELDLELHCWRMYQAICLWGPQPSLQTLPKSGITVNGLLFQLPALVQHTNVNDCSLLPTLTSALWNSATSVESARNRLQQGEKYSSRLMQAVAIMESPTATGFLNPEWAELLMGFPIGWTELQD